MFKSLGNILVNVEVGRLFIVMHGKPYTRRVNGTATVSREDRPPAPSVRSSWSCCRACNLSELPVQHPDLELIDPSIDWAPAAGS